MTTRSWNHNSHYHRPLLRLVPAGSHRALDIGCGDGTFARHLAARCAEVVALDDDPAQVERARRTCAGLRNVAAVRGDFLSVDLGHEPFDVVTALASLHHLPFAPAVARIQELLRPGGRLLVLGVWEDRATRRDRALNQVAALTNKVHQWAWGPDRMDAPATEPEMTLAQVRHDVSRRLPGASVRRHLLWRYTLAWQKPSPS